MAQLVIAETVVLNPGAQGSVSSCILTLQWSTQGLTRGIITVRVARIGGPIEDPEIEAAIKNLTCVPARAEVIILNSTRIEIKVTNEQHDPAP